MNYFVLASHGKYAQGLKDTILFFKPDAQIETIEQTMTDSDFTNRAKAILEAHQDENVVVFSDLFGGSVNQAFMSLLPYYHFQLITGMNLALVLDCMFALDDLTAENIQDRIDQAKDQFAYMNPIYEQMIRKKDTEDDDD